VWRELRFVGIGSDMRESEVSLFGWTLPLSASSASAVAVKVWEFLKVGTYETSSY
jgi:hypothetical protein